MGQFHWDPVSYLELMRSDVPAYDRLQDEVARTAAGLEVADVLDLGTGTGETARRVLGLYPRESTSATTRSSSWPASRTPYRRDPTSSSSRR